MADYYSRPTSSFGYYRGGGSEIPLAHGQGSGYGPANQGAGMFPQGQGPAPTGPVWHPTVIALAVLVVAEVAAVGLLSRVLER